MSEQEEEMLRIKEAIEAETIKLTKLKLIITEFSQPENDGHTLTSIRRDKSTIEVKDIDKRELEKRNIKLLQTVPINTNRNAVITTMTRTHNKKT